MKEINRKVRGGVTLAGRDKSEKFIPTMEEWWGMWSAWADKLASSLWKYGSKDACLDVVKDVFLKAMGLHGKLHLKEPLTPKTLGEWYQFLYHQARGRLSNLRKHDERAQGFSTSDEEEIWAFGTEDYDIGSVGREDLRREIRRVIVDSCRRAGFGDKAIRGFLAMKLHGLSGQETVALYRDIPNTNALFVRNNAVLGYLKRLAEDSRSELHRLWKE